MRASAFDRLPVRDPVAVAVHPLPPPRSTPSAVDGLRQVWDALRDGMALRRKRGGA